jgi:DNA-binding beta-propeller fold protein YncE
MQGPNSFPRIAYCTLAAAALILLSVGTGQATDEERPFLPQFLVSSTIPANGDLNPYGVALIPDDFPGGGLVRPGDVLVSNFNNSANLEGTGTTIIKLTPPDIVPSVTIGQSGNAVTFFQSNLAGLSTALGVLQRGFILVGNVPTTDGTPATLSQGALQVVDRHGNLLETLSDATFLDSPWDLTIRDLGTQAQVFVSNVQSGTVVRLDVAVSSSKVTVLNKTQIAVGYAHATNPVVLVLGPTGLAYDPHTDVLYVASTADNAIFAVPHAGKATAPVMKGTPIFADPHLRGPLALVFAPNGHLLTTNGDAVNSDPTHPSEIVEFTKSGGFIREFNVDAGQGGAFGMAILSGEHGFNFAAVDDVPNDISFYSLPTHHGSEDRD